MKTSHHPVPLSLLSTVILFAVCGAASAQQAPQGYYYQPQQESTLKRMGRNVGDFFRRSFYGQPAPTYQAPAYRQPGGTARSYSLDAPPSSQGYARSQSYGNRPQYQTPRASGTPQKGSSSSARTSTSAASRSKSSPPATASRGSTESKKRYTPPSKPSSFKKAPSHPSDEPVRNEREETVTAPSNPPLPLPNSTPDVEKTTSTPTPPGSTEARLGDPRLSNTFPLPGASPRTESSTISPTYSSDAINLGPTKLPVEDAASTTTSSSGTAKSGSFLVGRKTSKPGRVISPYAPYNELDVAGLPAGSLALDPTTQKVFQVP